MTAKDAMLLNHLLFDRTAGARNSQSHRPGALSILAISDAANAEEADSQPNSGGDDGRCYFNSPAQLVRAGDIDASAAMLRMSDAPA